MKNLLAFLIILGNLCLNTKAQTPGSKDNTWSNDGLSLYSSTTGYQKYFRSAALSNDNKVVVAGYYLAGYSGTGFTLPYYRGIILRYTSSGILDNAFNSNGVIDPNISSGEVKIYAATIQNDGKVLVTGIYSSSIGQKYIAFVARYNTDGSIDYTFNSTGIFSYSLVDKSTYGYSIYLHSDGTIIVGGEYFNINNKGSFVLRLTSSGNLDNTFGDNGVFSLENDVVASINSIIVSSDGKIIGAGGNGMIKLLANGTLDNTFGSNGKVSLQLNSSNVSPEAKSIAFQNDKIVVTGSYSSSSICLLRYNSNGSIDDTFVGNTLNSSSDYKFGFSTAVQNNEKIIISGQTTSGTKLCVIRLNSDGSIDNTFATNGILIGTGIMETYSSGYSCTIQNDGNILVAGYSSGNASGIILRLYGDPVATSVIGYNNEVSEFKIYPNPLNDYLKIECTQNGSNISKIEIFDLTGRSVFSEYYTSNVVSINTSSLHTGKYVIRILTDNNKVYQSKIIKK